MKLYHKRQKMNNPDGANMDLCVSRISPEENPEHNPKENPLFSSPSSGVDPSLCDYDLLCSRFQTLKINNPDGDYTTEENPEENPEENTEHNPEKNPEENPEENPEHNPEKNPEENPEENPEHNPEKNPEENPEENTEHNPEKNPEENPEENPEHNPEKNPEENPEENPEHNPEKNPEENPEENPEHNPEKNPLLSSRSSSCVDPRLYKYDVFISFRGEDTRLNFTSHLYKALCQNRIRAFIDEDRLEKGDDVSRALPDAIEESAISIIIFSTNYASSTWCLDELVHILKCKKDKDQIAVPIFHGVDPSDIRKQKRSYADAFVEHQQRFNNAIDKVQEWRQALKEASGICGWDSRGKSEADIVEKVVKDVQEKLKNMGSNGLIEDLLKRLKTKLRSANMVLNDAEEKQLTNQAVKEWLDDLKEVIFRADDLTDRINYEELRRNLKGASESSSSFATFNKSVEDDIAEILLKLEELTAQKDELGLTELSQRSYGAPLDLESEVHGREDDKKAILTLVLSDEDCVPVVLPIVGMGGMGKTTLAQLVYNDKRAKSHFQILVWVTISTEFDVFNITKQIFEAVTSKEFNGKETSQLQRELSEALEGKKYLFVLDDVWNEDYFLWDELRCPFKYGKSGSKIIITTRSSKVASTTSRVEAYNLRGLSNEDCWKIFTQHAFENEELLSARPDLKKIGEGIVEKCRGLPLAVKSVAALLRSISSLDEWRMILENQIWDLKLQENARKYVLPALWLSYRHLFPELKRCFAYCSIFPKDYIFDKEDLILLWMGEGLLEASGGARMEDIGEEYFKILTSRSFFQPSVHDNSWFIMHDCVHDLATFVLGDFGFRLEDNNLHKLPSKTRLLSIMMETINDFKQLDGISKAQCLRTFLLLENFGFSSDLFTVPRLNKLLMEEGCLRVLSLHCCHIAELPYSISNLKHLRYLDLSGTSIQEIPETIFTLYNLETLMLKGCRKLTRLPTDIARLTKLRHLDFSRSSIKELPLQIFDMKDLQTLQPSFILQKEHADSSIKKLGAFQQLHGQLGIQGLQNVVDVTNVFEAKLGDKMFITALDLRWVDGGDDVWDDDSDDPVEERDPMEEIDPMEERYPRKERKILDQLRPHTNLKTLHIRGYSGTEFSAWMGDESFSSIVKVELFECYCCGSLWPLDQLPSLKTLSIVESFMFVETINWEFFSKGSSMTKPFRSLEFLYLRDMTELKEWLFREGEVVFPTLKTLWLDKCKQLEVRLLPDCFPSLTTLNVEFCRQLKLIPATHQGLIFPSLQRLLISHCPEQEFILEGGLPSNLEIITISGCGNLKALDNNGFRLLTSLRKLKIVDCKELQCLPDLPSYPFDLEIEGCPILHSRCQENGEDWLKIKHARVELI